MCRIWLCRGILVSRCAVSGRAAYPQTRRLVDRSLDTESDHINPGFWPQVFPASDGVRGDALRATPLSAKG